MRCKLGLAVRLACWACPEPQRSWTSIADSASGGEVGFRRGFLRRVSWALGDLCAGDGFDLRRKCCLSLCWRGAEKGSSAASCCSLWSLSFPRCDASYFWACLMTRPACALNLYSDYLHYYSSVRINLRIPRPLMEQPKVRMALKAHH